MSECQTILTITYYHVIVLPLPFIGFFQESVPKRIRRWIQTKMWAAAATCGATTAFHLEERYQTEAFMVMHSIFVYPYLIHTGHVCTFWLFSNSLQAPIQSQVDTSPPIWKRSLVLLDTEDHKWDPPWIQVTQHRVSDSFNSCFFMDLCCSLLSFSMCWFEFSVVWTILSLVFLTLDYATWRSNRSHVGTSSYASSASKSTPGLVPHPPVQSLHGRRDWSAKYGHR